MSDLDVGGTNVAKTDVPADAACSGAAAVTRETSSHRAPSRSGASRPKVRVLLRAAVAATLATVGTALLMTSGPVQLAEAQGTPLTQDEVRRVVANCLHFADRVPSRPALTVAVVDVEGNVLGVFHDANVPADPQERANRAAVAISKASTGTYFSSDDQTFSTRSAAFIIQDHFPPGVLFQPGGPLYGVEFSSTAGSDVNPIASIDGRYFDHLNDAGSVPASFLNLVPAHPKFPLPAVAELRVRGDLGGVGLYKGRRRVGGLGVDDGNPGRRVTIPTGAILDPKPYRISFSNLDRGRDLERISIAGAGKHLAPRGIRADQIIVGGIRLPYANPDRLGASRAGPLLTPADGDWDPDFTQRDPVFSPGGPASHFNAITLSPPPGEPAGQPSFQVDQPLRFPIRAGTDGILTDADVRRILYQGVRQASITRAAIRRPIGLAMQCWVSVVDTNGAVLGVVRFTPKEATLFSYDVAIQKARTAAFFSDDKVAFTARAVGMFSQGFYPAGQQDQGRGPLHQIQDGLFVGQITGGVAAGRIPNGITIFPGGAPLYKNGAPAGGIGVSGDGVDQDDIVADLGSRGFGAPPSIRCDNVSGAAVKNALRRALARLEANAGPAPAPGSLAAAGRAFFDERLRVARATLERTVVDVPTVWIKYPRHPGPVTIR